MREDGANGVRLVIFKVSLGEAQVLYGIWLNIARTDNSVELYMLLVEITTFDGGR